MKFTFGIITDGTQTARVVKIIESIYKQMIDVFEIIVVGGERFDGDYLTHIPFDESKKPKWITKKKNIVTENALYDNIVYLHDYITFLPNWYRGYREFGDEWDICMNKILNYNGSRFRDWCIWADKDHINDSRHNREPGVRSNIIDRILAPYEYTNIENMYISGAYFVVKKYVMEKFPLDENLVWGQGEDVKWSGEVLLEGNCKYVMNTNSCVKLMKPKDVCARVYTEQK